MRVFSFVAPSQRGSFSGDLKAFYNHLIQNNGFPGGSQYLISKSPLLSLILLDKVFKY
jgi:xyloglucan-specific endo-beta-1,4-glucanase